MSIIPMQFDDAGPDNANRADWAEHAVSIFCEETGLKEAVERDDAVSDLICDLGHYCDRHGLDFVTLASRAIGVWDAERREEDNGEHNALYPERKVLISLLDRATSR